MFERVVRREGFADDQFVRPWRELRQGNGDDILIDVPAGGVAGISGDGLAIEQHRCFSAFSKANCTAVVVSSQTNAKRLCTVWRMVWLASLVLVIDQGWATSPWLDGQPQFCRRRW